MLCQALRVQQPSWSDLGELELGPRGGLEAALLRLGGTA